MDLTKFTTDDLVALKAGDLSRVSTVGLQALKAEAFAAKVAAQQEKDRAEYDPTKDMSTSGKFLAGVGKGMSDLVLGARQRMGFASQDEVDATQQRDRPLMNTTAGQAGVVTGNVAAAVPAAFIPGGNALAGASAIGAAQGLLQPTQTGESVTQNALTGAALGAGGVVAGRAIKAGYQGAKGLIEPFSDAGRQRIVGRTLERFAADPVSLRITPPAGPTATGAIPTLAESTADTGLASLQRAVEQLDPAVAAMAQERLLSNNAARIGTLAKVAGDPAKRAAAEAAREAAAGQMYKAATSATYTVDDELAKLLQRPAVKQAMERAKTLAANQGRGFTFDVVAPNPMSGLGVPTQTSKQITGQGLQDLKMAMDEMLSDPASGFTGKAGDTIKTLRGKIIDWMEGANPDFKTARKQYAELSKPINAMDVGERLLDKASSATRDFQGNRRLQANALARALNNEQQTVQLATGFKGAKGLDDVLAPDQMAAINAVRNELELSANLAQAANGPGSQTAKSLASQNIVRQMLGPTGLPQSWAESALTQTMLRPVQFALNAAEPRITGQLGNALLDPAVARAAIAAAKKSPRIANALAPYLPTAQSVLARSVPAAGLVAGQRGEQ